MTFELISLYDRKAGVYAPPMYYSHRAYMMREMQNIVASGKGAYSLYPDDFDVVKVGEFEDREGKLVSLSPSVISNLSAFKAV